VVPVSVLWICAFVVVGVFAVMIHSIATFRRAQEPGARPNAPVNSLTEIFWAIIPIFIMVSTALPAVRMLAAEQATCCGSGFSRTALNADRK
jgi:heme/copper-type cytochrome/quinol oxidase subunit 2